MLSNQLKASAFLRWLVDEVEVDPNEVFGGMDMLKFNIDILNREYSTVLHSAETPTEKLQHW